MKDCPKIHPLLALEAEGALSPGDHRKVQAHLKDCANARRELESLRRLVEAMGKLPAPTLPRNLHESIMERLNREGLSPAPKSWIFKPLWPLAAAAATTIFFFTQNPEWREIMTRPSAQPPAPAPALDKNQLEAYSQASKPAAAPAPEAKASAPPRELAVAPVPAQEERDSETLASVSNAPAESAARKKVMAFSQSSASASGARQTTRAPAASGVGANLMRAQAFNGTADAVASAKDFKKETPSSWNGDQDPLYTTPNQQVLTDAAGFLRVWQALKPGEAPPTIDFTRQAVLFIETGEEPTAGYVAEILRVESKPGQLLIYYSVQMPSGALAAQVESHPWVLKIIPKPTVPVFFQQEP